MEWYCEDCLLDDPALMMQITTLAQRRKGYAEHRKDKPNCKQRKLHVVVMEPRSK